MKLVSVTATAWAEGSTQPTLNWDQTWVTAPHWRSKEASPVVTQEAIGTTPKLPIYVSVDQGGIPSWATLILTLGVALAGAFGGQMLAHERAARRATDERYVDAVDQLLIASAAINGGFDSVMFALDATDPTLLVTATDKVDRAIDGWQAASMSMEVRIRGANPVIPLMHEADKAVQAFREQILGKPTITGLTSIHDRFVEKVNALTQEAQRQIGAATPGMPASATT